MPHQGPLTRYRARVQAGQLTLDPDQERAAAVLQRVHGDLVQALPPEPILPTRGRFARLFGGPQARQNRPEPPRGAYLHGEVGRGKSMIMDLFFEGAPVDRKRRVHFHAFMLEVHKATHAWRQSGGAKRDDDALPQIANDIAADTHLLCFDEFHVTDVADAMILGRLFTLLFERGVVIVATSNVAPDDLYENGLQRDRFLPVIDLIKARMEPIEMVGGRDYRRTTVLGEPVYFCPLTARTRAEMRDAFAAALGGKPPAPVVVPLMGRTLLVRKGGPGVAWFTYGEISEGSMGAADFLAIAETFHTVFLADVPELKPERRNEAKRFILLIDALYEAKRTLVMSADAPADDLYPKGHHAMEFQRTASRLMEMQSEAYLNAAKAGRRPLRSAAGSAAGSAA